MPNYDSIKLIDVLHKRDSEFYSKITECYDQVSNQLTLIPTIFPNYTMHDINHCERIMDTMWELIDDIKTLNDFEIALLIYSALLHDIGMSIDSTRIDLIKQDKLNLSPIKYEKLLEKFNGNEIYAVQDIVRRIHAELSAELIQEHYSHFLRFRETGISFVEDIQLVCISHTKDHLWVDKNLSGIRRKDKFSYNLKYVSILLRLADILDIDTRRTPQILYKVINPEGQSSDEWKQHFVIHNTKKIELGNKSELKKVILNGSCSDPSIHRKLLKYIGWINEELRFCVDNTEKMDNKYKVTIKDRVEYDIKTKGYTISDYKLQIDFAAITGLLMGENIYEQKHLGLRELIQNSIDACKLKLEINGQKLETGEEEYIPNVKIIIIEDEDKFIIKDNGIGMNEEIIKNYFLNVGRSYYRSDDFILQGFNYKPIGNFGIGFLSCFMLSDKVVVFTKHYKGRFKHILQLEKGSEYICFSLVEDETFSGTEVHLSYQQVAQILNKENIKLDDFLENYFLTDVVKIDKYIIKNKKREKSTRYYNSLMLPTGKASNIIVLDLEKYLSNIQGYIVFEHNLNFLRNISDLNMDNPFYYDNELKDDVENVKIVDIYNNFKCKYLSLPLFEGKWKYKFETLYDILDDADEVLSKIDPNNECNIFFPKGKQDELQGDDLLSSFSSYIIDDLQIDDITNIFIDAMCPKIELKEIALIGDNNLNTFLHFFDGDDFIAKHNLFAYAERIQLFIRDILIDKYFYKPSKILSGIRIRKMKINIVDTSIIPNIARKSLNKMDEENLNYAISKCLYLGLLEKAGLQDEEKSALLNFINYSFRETNSLLKE